ncbi:MAG TPA: TMEM175 family protein [Candidatus Dormibacteraeota bacterium]|nr:TMEM175 family protein [Candidatus Dormibacteraeota bacterium]
MNRTRTEAFSDGVFAVAATLLVFSVQVPDVKANLGRALLDLWPAYAAYVVSFATILVIWVNHHSVMDSIKSFDRPLLYLNGMLMMVIAVIPFPTFVFAKYLVAGHDESAAGVAYGITMTLASLLFGAIDLYIRQRRLITARPSFLAFSIGQLFYPIATLISIFSARLAIVLYGALVVYYAAFPLVTERQSRPR